MYIIEITWRMPGLEKYKSIFCDTYSDPLQAIEAQKNSAAIEAFISRNYTGGRDFGQKVIESAVRKI